MAAIVGKITAFQPCATKFHTDTTTFQPIMTIGSGALRATEDAVVLKLSMNERGQNKLPAEKKENLSPLSSHTLRRNQGAAVRFRCDFAARVNDALNR